MKIFIITVIAISTLSAQSCKKRTKDYSCTCRFSNGTIGVDETITSESYVEAEQKCDAKEAQSGFRLNCFTQTKI